MTCESVTTKYYLHILGVVGAAHSRGGGSKSNAMRKLSSLLLFLLVVVVVVLVVFDDVADGIEIILMMMVVLMECFDVAGLMRHHPQRGGRPDAQPSDAQQPPRIGRMSEQRLTGADGCLVTGDGVCGVRCSRQHGIVSGND